MCAKISRNRVTEMIAFQWAKYAETLPAFAKITEQEYAPAIEIP